MRIAVINETSAGDRNGDVVRALDGRGHEIVNCGMKKGGEAPELTYIHTGLLAGLLLGTGRVDMVVGGCGTGIGFLNAALQMPGVICGLIQNPLDAFLFSQINGGNCISLALNYGYGWAAERNLSLIFDQFFVQPSGGGFPAHRQQSQAQSRQLLGAVSEATHRELAALIDALPADALMPAINYLGIKDILLTGTSLDPPVAAALSRRWTSALV
jgi:ribose 5-phosphate isomerase RpiB